MFYICRSCYRGRSTAGRSAAAGARANRRYQQDPEIRSDHCQRQREYRERCRLRRVTDHTSAGGARSGNIKKPLTETGIRTPLAEVFQDRPRIKRRETAARPVCIVCGL